MSVYTSIEYIEIEWDSGSESTWVPTVLGTQDPAQCVPFHSWWNSSTAAVTDQHQDRLIEVQFRDNGGTPEVRVVATSAADADNRTAGIFIVEFDPSITVEQRTVTGFTGTSVTQAINDVSDQTTAFMIYSYQYTAPPSSDDDHNDACVQVRFNSTDTDNALLSRRASGGTVNGTLYVVKCSAGEFTVDHREIDVTTSTAVSGSDSGIDTTVLADSFCVHSYESSEGSDDLVDAAWLAWLSSTTQLDIERSNGGTPGSTSTHSIAIVECQGGEWEVQRGAGSVAANGTSQTDSITTIDQNRAVILHGGHNGWTPYGETTETNGNDNDQQMMNYDFSTDSLVRIRRGGAVGNANVRYEVIEFQDVTPPTDFLPYYSGDFIGAHRSTLLRM